MTDDRYQRGLELLKQLHPTAAEQIVEPLGDLGEYIIAFAFGDIYARPGLALRERSIATISILTAMGREAQLRPHLEIGLRLGLTAQELEEVILHTVPYAGFPTAMNALRLLREVLAEQEPRA
jgi:4-carboxymuconolactone decarboxylase